MAEQQGITKISVQGFKSLYDKTEVEIRPLTILAGANSSGKSSIMQPLLLMKQTLEASYDAGTLKLDGANTQFTQTQQFLSTGCTQFTIDISVDDTSVSITYGKIQGKLEISRTKYITETYQLDLRPKMTENEIEAILPQELRNIYESLMRTASSNKKYPLPENQWKWTVEPSDCMLDVVLSNESRTSRRLGISVNRGEVQQNVVQIIHVPGLRGNPKRNYPSTTLMGPNFEGTFDAYVAGIIHRWQEKSNKSGRKKLSALGQWLELLNLTSRVRSKPIDDTRVELLVDRQVNPKLGRAGLVSIADVGFGVSQVMPVLVALLIAKEGQLVYIEQPELHLHPRAQVKLAQILADAANRGVRVVVETHSSLLLLGIQTLIAEGKLKPENTILHWFTRDAEGKTKVDSQEPDENGAYGEWPEDFADVELDTQSKYLNAVAHRQEQVGAE